MLIPLLFYISFYDNMFNKKSGIHFRILLPCSNIGAYIFNCIGILIACTCRSRITIMQHYASVCILCSNSVFFVHKKLTYRKYTWKKKSLAKFAVTIRKIKTKIFLITKYQIIQSSNIILEIRVIRNVSNSLIFF